MELNPVRRGRGNPNWKKGVGGNPSGRPKATAVEQEVRALAQNYGPEAIETAAKIMRNTKNTAGVRLQAVDLLLNRGFGRPIQPHSNPDLSPLDFNSMGTEDLLDVLRRIENQLNNVPDVVTIVGGVTSLVKFDG